MKTRDRIIQYLQENQSGSINQISRDLGLTRADIRHHISTLVNSGMVQNTGTITHFGRGRPACHFKLSASPSVHLLSLFLDSFIVEISGKKELYGLQLAIIERIIHNLINTSPQISSPSIAMNNLVDDLAAYGFRLRWEAGRSGAVVTILSEPITSLIPNREFADLLVDRLVRQINQKSPR